MPKGDASKKAHKTFLKYGTQGLVADFAYDKDRKFFKKGIDQHFGTFYFAGLGGVMQAGAMSADFNLKRGGLVATNFILSAAGYTVEYLGASYVKGNYQGFYTNGWQAKASVYGYKALMYSLMIR